MNIQTVAENLRNTIAGKEELLAKYNDMLESLSNQPRVVGMIQINNDLKIAWQATAEYLRVNIDELKRILQDVEQCAKQASDDSWITNPDRMGGGGWTAEELDPNRGWK